MDANLILAGLVIAVGSGGWEWQLQSPFDLSLDVKWYNLDPDNHAKADLDALRARGVHLICYVSVGTWEEWRQDALDFPAGVKGQILEDWQDEKWLDIRRRDLLVPIMAARFEKCAEQGFEAVEPDNINLHNNDTGFGITRDDSLAYLRDLAAVARGLGLAIGQKNAPDLAGELAPDFDFMIAEECFKWGWCGETAPYLARGKPVLAAEYIETGIDFSAACAQARQLGIEMIIKSYDLDASRITCEDI